MTNSLKIENFQDSADCKTLTYQSRESFLKCSYDFAAGKAYGIVSDFGCGSWGLVTCLGGRGTDKYSGVMIVNEKEVSRRELNEISCFVAENVFPGINSPQELLTPEKCIEKALAVSGQAYSAAEIKDIFCLSDSRFKRPLENVSGEIWQISAAINFALGKDVFCYPWLNEINISRFEAACEIGTIDFLKKAEKIILVPSSQEKKLKKLCDRVLKFRNGKFTVR